MDTSIFLLWDTLKAVVRGMCLAISAQYNKERRVKRVELEGRVRFLETHHKQTGSRKVYRELQEVHRELMALDLDAAEYALLRIKQRYYCGSNKAGIFYPTSLGLRLSSNALPPSVD